MYDALAKILVDAFLVIGLGVPAAFSVTAAGRSFLPRLLLTSALFSSGIIYIILFMANYFSVTRTGFLVLLTLAFGLPIVLKRTTSNIRSLAKFPRPRFTFLEVILVSISLLLLLVTAFSAISSVAVLDDPLAVWLYLGKEIYAAGRIPVFFGNAADISWSGNYPPNASFMAASIDFVLNGANAFDYGLVPWLYGALAVVCVPTLVRELGGTRKGALVGTTACLLTSTFSLQLLGWGYTDTIETFFVSAFLVFVLLGRESSGLSGFLGALAFAEALLSKYDVLLLLIPSLPFFLYFKRDLFRTVRLSGYWVAAGVLFGLFALSWYFRNWTKVGDPIYPYLYNIFNARGISPNVISLVPSPSFQVSSLFQDQTLSGLGSSGDMWPALILGVVGVVLLLVRRRENERTRGLALWVAASLVALLTFVALGRGFERYLIVVIPALSVLAGLVFDKLDDDVAQLVRKYQHPVGIRRGFRAAFLLCLLLISAGTIGVITTAYAQPTLSSADASAWSYLNGLPRGVVATNDIRLFYIDQPVVQLYNIPGLFGETNQTQSWGILKENNVSYVYFDPRFDLNIFESHTSLIKLFGNSTYMSLIYSSQANASAGLQIYKVN